MCRGHLNRDECHFFCWPFIFEEWSDDLVVKELDSLARGSEFKTRVAQGSTQPLIFPRSIKWVQGPPGDWVVKSKLSLCSLETVEPIHKKRSQSCVQITGKCIYVSKNWISTFLLMPLQRQNFPHEEGNFSFHPGSIFLKICPLLPPQKGKYMT